VPAGDAWLHELKLDGYRLQIIKDRRDLHLFTRRGAGGPNASRPSLTLSLRSPVGQQFWTVSWYCPTRTEHLIFAGHTAP
jgi:hypothetical protein